MKIKQPVVTVPGDNANHDMARHGGIVGVSYLTVCWGFGFLPNSEYAKLYGVSTDKRVFVLAGYDGKVKDTFTGLQANLPKNFRKVVDFRFLFADPRNQSGLTAAQMDDGVNG